MFINYMAYYKLRRDNLTEKELCDIADILNCDYDGIFTFRDTGKQWSRDSRESLLFLYEKLNSSLDNVA